MTSKRPRIQRVEAHVKRVMGDPKISDLAIAHDYSHVDRVRNWALEIARGEAYAALDLVQACALLHDVGLAHVEQRGRHAQVGAEVAARFLRQEALFAEREIDAIAAAIRSHSSLSGGGPLGAILRDADMLDGLGAVGLLRAAASRYANPEYDPRDVKGAHWGKSGREFDRLFAAGQSVGATVVDQVNFQISWYDNLNTDTARRLARPLVQFMQRFILQLESEVTRP